MNNWKRGLCLLLCLLLSGLCTLPIMAEPEGETIEESVKQGAEPPAEETAENPPTEETAEKTPTEETAEKTSTEETAEKTPTEETAEKTPTEETAEKTPTEETEETTEEIPTDEAEEELAFARLQDLLIARSAVYAPGTTMLRQDAVLLCNEGEGYTQAIVFQRDTESYILPATHDNLLDLYFTAHGENAGDRVFLSSANAGTLDITNSSLFKVASMLSPGRNHFTITVEPGDGERRASTYTFSIDVLPTLTTLGIEGESLDPGFKARENAYSVLLDEGCESLVITAKPRKADYVVMVDGEMLPSNQPLALDVTGKETIAIAVTAGTGGAELTNTYTLALRRAGEIAFSLTPTPADAVVKIYDSTGRELSPRSNGEYVGRFGGEEHHYTVTKYGYVSKTGVVPAEGGELAISLEPISGTAPAIVDAPWANFRNSDTNMAITDIPLPTEADKDQVALIWNRKLGEGWGSAPSVQIVVDNSLVVLCGTKIYKLDLSSGETLQSGEMKAAPDWGYTPPTYGEGMIFCPLTGGVIQAFDATTLQSLWCYTDPLGGQSLSPITYAEGYLYTGFWTGEETPGSFVCLSVSDEYPEQTDESKPAVWRISNRGGFYWSGSVVLGDAVFVGNCATPGGAAAICSYNRKNGALISKIPLTDMGNQRSSLAYDAERQRLFFTTQGGFLGSVAVDTQTGKLSDLKCWENGQQSTSTPVIYGDRAYYGIGGGITDKGSSGSFVVARADTLETLYTVPLRGYPQGSQLLSTSYAESGYLYFYMTYNSKPGGITVIRIDPTIDTAEGAVLTELYEAQGFEEYCIASLICTDDGTLYYKNDSGYVLAVGVPRATQVIELIDKIPQSVTATDREAIEVARAAYNALRPEDREKVTNYEQLLTAEDEFASIAERILSVEALIKAIGDVKNDERSRQAVQVARGAFNELSETEQAQVANRQELEACEARLKNLQAGGHTRGIDEKAAQRSTFTLNGITYTVDKQAATLMQDIQTTLSRGECSPKQLLDLYKNYNSLSEGVKGQIYNYELLEDALHTLGESWHRDGASGIMAETLPWYVRLHVQELANGKEYEKLHQQLEKQAGSVLLGLWEITLEDVRNGETIQPIEPLKLSLTPAQKEWKNYPSLYVLHLSDDGNSQTLSCTLSEEGVAWETDSCSLFALVGSVGEATAALPDELPLPLEGQNEGREKPLWGLLLPGVLGLGLLTTALVLRKKNFAKEGAEE